MNNKFINRDFFAVFLISMAIALLFFYYGTHLPFAFRVRADAYQYIDISTHFTSLHEALFFVGNRTIGFPLFEYLFKTNPFVGIEILSNRICLTLFLVHELTMLILCWVAYQSRIFKHTSYLYLLFLILSTYPALIMHTTTPLTDTFGADLILLGLSCFAWNELSTSRSVSVSTGIGVLIGFLFSYAILVRPAYWSALLGFVLFFMIFSLARVVQAKDRFNALRVYLILSTLAIMSVLLSLVLLHCKTRYGQLCLQNPDTFSVIRQMQDGLVGGRVLWGLNEAPFSGVPVVPDPFMFHYFYQRCPITHILGFTHNSYLGCLTQYGFFSIWFLIKKCIGLFDAFRMTPYTELITPIWYICLSRMYSCLAFTGFMLLIYLGFKQTFLVLMHQKPLPIFLYATLAFVVLLIGTHAVFHVEERYIFPCIPICLMVLVYQLQHVIEVNSTARTQRWITASAVCLLIGGLFFIQITQWDHLVKQENGTYFVVKYPD